jgi:hypothetical protein
VAHPTQKSKRQLEINPKRYPVLKAEDGFLFSKAIISGTKEKYATKPRGEGGKAKLNKVAENIIRYKSFLFINESFGILIRFYNLIPFIFLLHVIGGLGVRL